VSIFFVYYIRIVQYHIGVPQKVISEDGVIERCSTGNERHVTHIKEALISHLPDEEDGWMRYTQRPNMRIYQSLKTSARSLKRTGFSKASGKLQYFLGFIQVFRESHMY